MHHRRAIAFITGGVILFLTAIIYSLFPSASGITNALAATSIQSASDPAQAGISNETCLSCHGQSGISMKLGNGETFGLYVPAEEFSGSIHGQKGYACIQCHTTVENYPHPAFGAKDKRDVTLQLNSACQHCHANQFELTQDSVHAVALKSGNQNAAVCTDCHTSHATRRLTDPQTHQLLTDARVWIPQTCAKCHNAIYQKYAESVHGSALVGAGNPDVPTCIDCHGVHNIGNPTTAAFRLKSPEICAKCHTNPKIMDKYGISTQVLSTYVADFHGTTVTLFEKQHPDQQTNKPVCFDCHGIHDIQRIDDPQKGLKIRENLLARCKTCHPDADINFPDAWLSHYIPSPKEHPLVYTVNTFYKFFIPTLLGGMALLVILDFSSIVRKRLQRKPTKALETLPTGEQPSPPVEQPTPFISQFAPVESAPSQEEILEEASAPSPEQTPVESAPSEEQTPPDETGTVETGEASTNE